MYGGLFVLSCGSKDSSGGSVGSNQDNGDISHESAGTSWGITANSSGSSHDVFLVRWSDIVGLFIRDGSVGSFGFGWIGLS